MRILPSFIEVVQFGWIILRQSKQAPHSIAEPLAIAKNLALSVGEVFPVDSAIFKGTEIEALYNWSLRAAFFRSSFSIIAVAIARNCIEHW